MNVKKFTLGSVLLTHLAILDSLAFTGYEGRNYLFVNTGVAKKDQSLNARYYYEDGTRDLSANSRKSKLTALYELGYGYNYTDGLRFDVSLSMTRMQYKHKYEASGVYLGSPSSLKLAESLMIQRYSAFVNTYYDIVDIGRAVPYFGLGFGLINDSLKSRGPYVRSLPNASKKYLGYRFVGIHTKKKRREINTLGSGSVSEAKVSLKTRLSSEQLYLVGLKKTF
jgi:hypothetical protein